MKKNFGKKKNENNYKRNIFQIKKLNEECNINKLNFPNLNSEEREIIKDNKLEINYKKLNFEEEQVIEDENKIKKEYLVLNRENILKYREEYQIYSRARRES